MTIIKYISAILLPMALLAPQSGETATVVAHKLTADDEQKISNMSDRFFADLQNAGGDVAVKNYLGNSDLMSGKTAELAQLAGQINTIIGIYGKISKCILVRTEGRGGVVEERQFICQHQKLATRWKLLFVKTTDTWVASNMFFDDKVMATD